MLFLVKILLLLLHLCSATVKVSSDKVIFCEWGVRDSNSSSANFEVDNIDPHLCTHFYYFFLELSDSGQVYMYDMSWESHLNKTVALKKINPNLKIIAGVMGFASDYFDIATEKEKTNLFITSAFTFLRKYGLDGIDIFFSAEDKLEDSESYFTFLQRIYPIFNSQNYILIISVTHEKWGVPQPLHNFGEMSQYFDLIIVLTDNYLSSDRLSHNAPLRADGQYNVVACIEYWISQGAPPSKIVMSIPLYAQSFTMPPLESKPIEKSPQYNTSVGAPSAGPRLSAELTYEPPGYNEICSSISDWTTEWDAVAQVPFSYKGDQWISYENEQSVAAKVKFIKEKNLAGAGVWSIEKDDFLGKCKSQKFPLIHAINSQLKQNS